MKKNYIYVLSLFFCLVLLQRNVLAMRPCPVIEVDQDQVEQATRRAIFLIEEEGQENVDHCLEFVALQFLQALTSEAACIFVSKFTLQAYLNHMSSWDDGAYAGKECLLGQFNVYKHAWQLYELDGTGYFLLVPKKYKTHLKNTLKTPYADDAIGLNVHGVRITKHDKLPQGNHTLTAAKSRRLSYLRGIADAAPNPSFESINFKDTFLRHAQHCPWVFYMAGHGIRNERAVGLTLEALHQFFTKISPLTQILTVHLNSCFVGGSTRTYFEAANYDFHLTLGSSGNHVAFIDETSGDFTRFFATIEDGYRLKTPSLEYLMRGTDALTLSDADEVRSVHPHMWSTPLARRRGEQSFSPISPSSLVRSLASSGNQPISNASIIQLSKAATLIRDELLILPTSAAKLSLAPDRLQTIKQAHWLQFLTAADLIHKCKNPWTSWQKYPAIQALYDDLSKHQSSCREKHDAFLEAITQLASEEYLYPALTSLHHTPISDSKKPKRRDRAIVPKCQGRLQLDVSDDDEDDYDYVRQHTSCSSTTPLDAEITEVRHHPHHRARPADLPFESHYFEKILVENIDAHGDILPHHGVLSFLRDSFFDILNKMGRNLFLIRTLQGNNDINLTLELCRYARHTSNSSSLEEWLSHHLNQQIYLEYVSLYTNNDTYSATPFEANLAFLVGRRGWRLQFKGNPQRLVKAQVWNFVELTPAEITAHLEQFNERKAWLEEEHCTTLV